MFLWNKRLKKLISLLVLSKYINSIGIGIIHLEADGKRHAQTLSDPTTIAVSPPARRTAPGRRTHPGSVRTHQTLKQLLMFKKNRTKNPHTYLYYLYPLEHGPSGPRRQSFCSTHLLVGLQGNPRSLGCYCPESREGLQDPKTGHAGGTPACDSSFILRGQVSAGWCSFGLLDFALFVLARALVFFSPGPGSLISSGKSRGI